ncbi:MAG: Asp23/Gls24 family envelope stress response protein [Candidatus Heteroscillospira sp.]|jgi:uncharacterized alkaline shock family protein YloU
MVTIQNKRGNVCITDDVITFLAGDAATNCFGVKGMAGKAKESGLYQLLRRESMSKGVTVTYNDDGSLSIRLHIVVDHGVNVTTLCSSIMNEVSYKLREATGTPVKSVDVYVDSMVMTD